MVLALQMAENTKVNAISAKEFVNLVCGDLESITWCRLVRPIINKATRQDSVKTQCA